ncbi:immobilization antigen (macronuclear) [Tetrahymena thermophila SB210]|uniref:Immobilization antigen n=1 Tax=Tetrahymena thermophila (strain SB210) TaxID=312017 RepID=Q232G9_TETTS|nr:immobilization antigen [Tetrahymena thermophila SB210]EAR91443.1 immobilization antigen [Tetrahymena thermophila SB210]|eukprot:XP_001011688.1 immobilization antigen [Tetrahymena thermophila SB210]
MKAISLILISLAVIATVNACTDAHATAGNGGTCFCNAGYYGTSTDVNGAGSCQKCPDGTTSAAATTSGTLVSSCTCIDVNAIPNGANTGCACKDNFYGKPTSSGASGCTPCPTGSISTFGSYSVDYCFCVDSNSVKNSSNTACQCKDNFYGTPNPTKGGATGCTACPSGTTSTAGTTDMSSCACPDTNASLNSANPPVCQCKANFYGSPTTSGASGCTACPNGQTAPAGSASNVCKASSSTYILPIVSLLFSLLMLI